MNALYLSKFSLDESSKLNTGILDILPLFVISFLIIIYIKNGNKSKVKFLDATRKKNLNQEKNIDKKDFL